MKNFIIIFLLILTVGCAQNRQQTIATETTLDNVPKGKTTFLEVKPYNVTLKIDNTDLNSNSLTASIDIYDKSFLDSPHSNKYFVDRFTISLEDNQNIKFKDSVVEFPKRLESQDPWNDGRVYLVKRNSIFTQKLSINSKNYFEVGGMLNFSINPSLPSEEVKFIITKRLGILSVEKLNTAFPFIK